MAYGYTYIDKSLGYLLIVAVYCGSCQRANKIYLYKVVDRSFDTFDLHAFFF